MGDRPLSNEPRGREPTKTTATTLPHDRPDEGHCGERARARVGKRPTGCSLRVDNKLVSEQTRALERGRPNANAEHLAKARGVRQPGQHVAIPSSECSGHRPRKTASSADIELPRQAAILEAAQLEIVRRGPERSFQESSTLKLPCSGPCARAESAVRGAQDVRECRRFRGASRTDR